MFIEDKHEWFARGLLMGFPEIIFRMIMLRVEEFLAKAGEKLIIKLCKKGVNNGCDIHV